MSAAPQLSPVVKQALQRELQELRKKFGTQARLAKQLGISEFAVSRAVKNAEAGGAVLDAVLTLVELSKEQLVAKHVDTLDSPASVGAIPARSKGLQEEGTEFPGRISKLPHPGGAEGASWLARDADD